MALPVRTFPLNQGMSAISRITEMPIILKTVSPYWEHARVKKLRDRGFFFISHALLPMTGALADLISFQSSLMVSL